MIELNSSPGSISSCSSSRLSSSSEARSVISVWERRGESPPTWTDNQADRRASESRALDRAEKIVIELSQDLNVEGRSVDTSTSLSRSNSVQSSQPVDNAQSWWGWTAGLVAASGTIGAVETLVARGAQEWVRVGVGQPARPEQVHDGMLAVGAAVNISVGVLAGWRTFLHVLRATSSPGIYARALRGQPEPVSQQREGGMSLNFAAAGTPDVPASIIRRAAASALAGSAVFLAAAHTGLIALSHIGSNSTSKPDAYAAVWASNGNFTYAHVRELVNAGIHWSGISSHDALLSLGGGGVTTGQYLVNSLLQRTAQQTMELGTGPVFDLRWPAISAGAEFIDVATVAGARRFGAPGQPVSFMRGRYTEAASSEQSTPHRAPTLLEIMDRFSQRATARGLVAEVTKVIPAEVAGILTVSQNRTAAAAVSWAGAVAAAGTHLREHMWQAETAVRDAMRNGRPPVPAAG